MSGEKQNRFFVPKMGRWPACSRSFLSVESSQGRNVLMVECSAALITSFFPKVISAFHPGYIFLFFCAMMVLQLIWVKTMVPETKGVSLEAMQRKLGIA